MKRDGGHSSDAFPSEDFWLRFPRSENIFRAHDQALGAGPTKDIGTDEEGSESDELEKASKRVADRVRRSKGGEGNERV